MFKRTRLLFAIILIAAAFLLTGCANTADSVLDTNEPHLEERGFLAATAASAADVEEEPEISASMAPLSLSSI